MKNKIAILLVLIVALSVIVNVRISEAQEQRSSSETWSGEIYLNETHTVNESETLTIEPGTTVYLAENVSIEVYGTLKAEGVEDNMITFTRWNTLVTGAAHDYTHHVTAAIGLGAGLSLSSMTATLGHVEVCK